MPRAGRRRAAVRPPRGDVLFFLGTLLFLTVTLGTIIVAQKMTIQYLAREFPRVAEHNYRAVQANLRAAEARLTLQLAEVSHACISARHELPPFLPPAPESVPQPVAP